MNEKISRGPLLKWLHRQLMENLGVARATIADVICHVEYLPATGWIPVAEKLPEEFTPVLVCRKKERGCYVVEQGCRDMSDWWKVYGTRTKKVTHWMPMPEPPEEE